MRNRARDYIIDQNWLGFTDQDHATWRTLFHRQEKILEGRAVSVFLDGVKHLQMAGDRIPRFEELSAILKAATGWEIVAVPGLVPDDIFFELLAHRQFPSTCFIRRPDQLDYLQEPDIFHDIFGHVPLLIQPIFADYMEAYGRQGLQAFGTGSLHYLARLYWYTVEFGLIREPSGLRIYGSGIVSSASESVFCLESPQPKRIKFERDRVMCTRYRIDDFQEVYFVIESFEQLMQATVGDFRDLYESLKKKPDFAPKDVLMQDTLLPANPS